ncbi:thioredoxin family protein [Marinobacter persicus]|jgi:small redox-active disulfide protein 2|uniref:Small redox-active disulfide protein 2 n=1 Tax=Marinobacter persicus TaxID=930118 RepID=A0A2S6G4W8_9GAMM|nr:thioredoxin family protein [Marinobacter persicus]PPK50735.1 small redox-active disulfide protein 2 [Marinobacter persicus]PPK54133.1 small redox-active disulfide protein 2 [Marinobacter persicus]PPK57320.1 small redox-active disulfide protein 2 [Marinobacter persicus]
MKTFEVLGTGCKKCVNTAEAIERTAKDLGESVEVIKVTDPARIMEYQVMSTPAVALDGKVIHSGSVPEQDKIAGWIQS